MRYALLLTAAGIALAACAWGNGGQTDHGSLAVDNAAVAVHLPCLDTDGDNLVSTADFGQPLAGGDPPDGPELPDFNADGDVDERDRAFLGAELALDAAAGLACAGDAPVDYLVGGDTPAIDCGRDKPAVIIVGVAGGSADLREPEDGAGVRYIANGLLDDLGERGLQTLAVIAGPAVAGAGTELHAGMETWLTHAVKTYLEQYPCATAVLLGHSHGAVTTDVVASRLEGTFADRIALVVALDRIDDLYFGDTASMPQAVDVLNIYETNDPALRAADREAPNVENWDASGEEAPKNGEEGGKRQPVLHSTIDNSSAVRARIIEEVRSRLSPE